MFSRRLPKVRSCVTVTGAAAHPADVFTVGVDLPLQQQLLIPCDAQVLPYLRRDAGEAGADVGLVGPGTDQVTGGALTQHGAQRVNDDGFTGAGLAGEGVEAGSKVISARSMMAIFSIWSNSSICHPSVQALFQRSISLISSANSAAAALSRSTSRTVSSPARDPTR